MEDFNSMKEKLKAEDPVKYYSLELMGKVMAKRDRLGISQRDLQKLSGVAHKTISRLENGIDVPSLGTVIKLAHALDMELKLVDKE